jgi:hypothetical protein
LGGYVEARDGQQGGGGNGFDFVHGAAQESKDAIVGPPPQNSNESFIVCLCSKSHIETHSQDSRT